MIDEDGNVMLGPCQAPTELNRYGLPTATCDAPSVKYRPNHLVAYLCDGPHPTPTIRKDLP